MLNNKLFHKKNTDNTCPNKSLYEPHGGFEFQAVTRVDNRDEKTNMAIPNDDNVESERQWNIEKKM